MNFLHEIADLVEDLGLADPKFSAILQVNQWGPLDWILTLHRDDLSFSEWNHISSYAEKHSKGWIESSADPHAMEWKFGLESGALTVKIDYAINNVSEIKTNTINA